MKTKVIFDKKKESRYLLTKEWEEAEPTIAVILLIAGMADAGNKKVKWRVSDVMDLLEAHKDKLYVIGDDKGQGYSEIFPKYKNLIKLGIPKGKAWEYVNTRKGYWRVSNSLILNKTFKNTYLEKLGYKSVSKRYQLIN